MSKGRPEEKESELDVALDDLQAYLDIRLDSQGGYPAQIDVIEQKWIVIADVDHDEAPSLLILDFNKYLILWRKAKKAEAKSKDGNLMDQFFEFGIPAKCAYTSRCAWWSKVVRDFNAKYADRQKEA